MDYIKTSAVSGAFLRWENEVLLMKRSENKTLQIIKQ